MMIKIRLQTLCGCEQTLGIGFDPGQIYKVEVFEPTECVAYTKIPRIIQARERCFRLCGRDADGVKRYVEIF